MNKRSILPAICYGLITAQCPADTFTLKDGSTVNGSILREEGDSYILEVQVTKSIKDERKVLKTDVVKKDREKLDLTAFAAIANLVPTPDFITADEFPPKISAVTKFIEQYPASSKLKDAKVILATLKAEQQELAAGGIKTNGRVLPQSQYISNAYEIDARIADAKIRRMVEAGDNLGALRAFSDFDRDYRTTISYGTLAPFMTQVIKAYIAELKESLTTLDARVKARQVGLQQMAMQDRNGTETAIKEENDAIEARFQAEKAGKAGWYTTGPYHKASIDESIKFGEQELTRLTTVKTVLGEDGGRLYRDAYNAVHNGLNSATVSAALAAAKAAMIPDRYLAPLESASKTDK